MMRQGNVRRIWLGAALMAGMAGSEMAQVGVADYERAANMLIDRMAPRVDNAVSNVTGLGDDAVAYVLQDAKGKHHLRFDRATG